MKKNGIKKGISIALAAAMTLGLAACGKGGGTTSADPNLAKQYVYSCQDIELPVLGDNYSIQTGAYRDGKIYFLATVYTWDENGDSQSLELISLNEDGTGVEQTKLQTTEASADGTSDNEGGEPAAGVRPEDVPLMETTEETADTKEDETSAEAAADIAVLPETGGGSVYEYTGYSNFFFTEDGFLYGLKNYNFEDYTDPENYTSKQENFLCKWDMEGNLLSENSLGELSAEGEYIYIQAVSPMEDGSVAVLYGGGDMQICTVDAQGNVSEKKSLGEGSANLQNASNWMAKGDGTFLVTYYDENDYSKMYIASYDPKTDTLGESALLPSSIGMMGYNAMSAGLTSDLIYTTSDGVYALNIGDTEPRQMMSFVNSDIAVSSMGNVIELDENCFVGIYYDAIDYDSAAGIFTKVKPEDIPDKEVLILAANYIGTDIKNRVVDYNKSSDKYRIVIKEYSTYATAEDYHAGYTQLNNDIISGNMPDILVADANVPIENYVSKGLFADIDSLLEKDEELSQKEFMENAFEAYRIEGKLYQVIPYFNVMTLAGKKSIVGDRTGWTMAEFKEMIAGLPEGTEAMSELTKSGFISMMMQYCGTDFVDVSTGKCNFDSQNFIDMLEYADTLPEQLPDDYYGDAYWESYQSQYREDRTVLMNCYISTIASMNSTINGAFGEEISFIGFPTESGKGSSVNVGETFALSAKSKNLEGAWDFVRYYLTDEYQETLQWGLPVLKDVFDAKAKEALNKPYYLDENNNKVEYNETYYINGENIELEPMTQEQVDQVVSFIESVNTRSYYNQDISKILEEETAAYFAGQKSAKEVAQIIQSRAQIYVSENR